MRNLITGLTLLMVAISFGQTKSLNGTTHISNGEMKIENLSIEVTVDSAEEVRTTFTTKAIKELIEESADGEEVSFKITCNGAKMSSGLKSNMSYEVKGNTNDKKGFLKRVKKIRNAAIKYYTSKQ